MREKIIIIFKKNCVYNKYTKKVNYIDLRTMYRLIITQKGFQ